MLLLLLVHLLFLLLLLLLRCIWCVCLPPKIHLTGDEITTGDTLLSCLLNEAVRIFKLHRAHRVGAHTIQNIPLHVCLSVPKYPKVIQQSMFNVFFFFSFLFVFVSLPCLFRNKIYLSFWAEYFISLCFCVALFAFPFGTLSMCFTQIPYFSCHSSFLKVKSLSKYPVFFSLLFFFPS